MAKRKTIKVILFEEGKPSGDVHEANVTHEAGPFVVSKALPGRGPYPRGYLWVVTHAQSTRAVDNRPLRKDVAIGLAKVLAPLPVDWFNAKDPDKTPPAALALVLAYRDLAYGDLEHGEHTWDRTLETMSQNLTNANHDTDRDRLFQSLCLARTFVGYARGEQ